MLIVGRVILWCIVITLGILLLVLLFRKEIEGFDTPDPEIVIRKEVNQYITLVNDILCPCYAQILDQKITDNLPDSQKALSASDQDPDERHKAKANAITDLANSTLNPPQRIKTITPSEVNNLEYSLEKTGLLFPCPPPTDPMLIPNNINLFIDATSKAFLPILDDIKKQIEKALSCPKKEGFVASNTENLRYASNDSETSNKYYGLSDPIQGFTVPKETFADVNNDPALKQQRIQTLQAKADILKKVLLSESFITLSAHYATVIALKKKAESGKMQSNCSV